MGMSATHSIFALVLFSMLTGFYRIDMETMDRKSSDTPSGLRSRPCT